MASSAGKVGSGNQGQNDMDRGSVEKFSYSKDQRKTGKVGGPSKGPNPIDKSGLSKPVSDPRLA